MKRAAVTLLLATGLLAACGDAPPSCSKRFALRIDALDEAILDRELALARGYRDVGMDVSVEGPVPCATGVSGPCVGTVTERRLLREPVNRSEETRALNRLRAERQALGNAIPSPFDCR